MPRPECRERPATNQALPDVCNDNNASLGEVVEGLTQLQRRMVAEAVLSAEAATWERRAATLEAARPRPGEFLGGATSEDLSRRWRELTEMAVACRSHAALLRGRVVS
jgi:hypothetical protein